jgi:endo-1,4-beta-mannosidase
VGNQLHIDDQPFIARGVNYYPRNTPWDRFLPDSSLGDIGKELHLISAAGFNTIRIFLWYDPLFECAPETASPDAGAFRKLDAIITMAARLNLRLIVTLNDLPDLTFRPLYTDYSRYDAQTAFIVDRYKNEPAILAWDLRNEGDIDYQSPKHPNRDSVLAWLKHISGIVRAIDTNHLTTAGWLENTLETADMVDILSFHHWSGVEDLTNQISYLARRSPKPILVEEVGYSSPNKAETNQAKLLGAAVKAAEQKGTAGWLVWTAFDFPPTGQEINSQNNYGVWHNDLSPKPALNTLPLSPSP